MFHLIYSDAAMDTDEAEKEVPAKKPKPDAVLVSEAWVQFVNCDYRIGWHKVQCYQLIKTMTKFEKESRLYVIHFY